MASRTTRRAAKMPTRFAPPSHHRIGRPSSAKPAAQPAVIYYNRYECTTRRLAGSSLLASLKTHREIEEEKGKEVYDLSKFVSWWLLGFLV